MKRVFAILLALCLLAIPVWGTGNLVNDGEGLLTAEEVTQLERLYGDFAAGHSFTPVLVTTESFGGEDAEHFAGEYYDSHGYPYDGILYLVSLTEGEWYILTNGACHDRISDTGAENIGEELVEYLRDGAYYEAFALFPELTALSFGDASVSNYGGVDAPTAVYETKNYGKTVAISMGVGLLIGLIAVGIMASQMKSVRQQNTASDYVRPGSMQLTNQRDIFLYSHVTRTAKPKNNSSSGGGGSRGGAGGRI